jgi:AcrR family transcriptional regulator
MADVAERVYGGRSGAQRVAERRDALVQATFGLIAQDGCGQLRIERICREAGLNKRYFYESFDDVDAAVEAVMGWLAQQAIDATLAAMDTTRPLPESVHQGVEALVRHMTEDPRRARVLFGETPAAGAAARHRAQAVHQVVRAAAAQGRVVHHLGEAPDPLIDLAGTLLVGGTSQVVLDWFDGAIDLTEDELIEHLSALWLLVGEGAAERALKRRRRR